MDKKRAITNITVGIIFKVILLSLSVITKSILVKKLGDEANGLYSLYADILGFLSIANLGIGTAIAFSMYRPIVENDKDSISALYYLFRRFYLTVFAIILVGGLLLTPVVPRLAKGNTGDINIYLTYFIFLISVIITYLFAHKTSLINAYKDNYITTFISSTTVILESALQIVLMILTQSFVYFLLIRILSRSLNGIITNLVFKKRYRHLINDNKKIENTTKKKIFKNSKAMFYYQIGGNLATTFDGIIISAFVGITMRGYYSNYITIVAGMTSLLYLLFSEITSIVGQLYVKHDKKTYFNQFKRAYFINFVVGVIFYLGFIAIGDELVAIIFGPDKVEAKILVIIIGINYYIQFMRRSITLFKTASGGFYNDRFRPFIEGLVNIVLSIAMVFKFGVPGVLIATIISTLLITYTYEPYVLFSVSFERSSKRFQIIHFLSVVLFAIIAVSYSFIPIPKMSSHFLDILVRGSASVAISGFLIVIVYLFSKQFRETFTDLKKVALHSINKKK